MPPRFAVAGLLTGLALLVACPLFAQHDVTVEDVRDGEQFYLASCTGCHGPEGDAVFGVDLAHGQFRRASTDEDLVRIIRTGIPGTSMPPGNFSEAQAGTIVAYLRSLSSSLTSSVPGDPDRGKTLFEGKGACLTCHRVNSTGSRLGPDLSDIGQFRRAPELERSLVDPSNEVLPQNRSYRVVTRDGGTITGRLLNHDSFTVQLIDGNEQLRSFSKSSLREYAFVDVSPMPSYRDKLSAEELTDLVRYLVALRSTKAGNR